MFFWSGMNMRYSAQHCRIGSFPGYVQKHTEYKKKYVQLPITLLSCTINEL